MLHFWVFIGLWASSTISVILYASNSILTLHLILKRTTLIIKILVVSGQTCGSCSGCSVVAVRSYVHVYRTLSTGLCLHEIPLLWLACLFFVSLEWSYSLGMISWTFCWGGGGDIKSGSSCSYLTTYFIENSYWFFYSIMIIYRGWSIKLTLMAWKELCVDFSKMYVATYMTCISHVGS